MPGPGNCELGSSVFGAAEPRRRPEKVPEQRSQTDTEDGGADVHEKEGLVGVCAGRIRPEPGPPFLPGSYRLHGASPGEDSGADNEDGAKELNVSRGRLQRLTWLPGGGILSGSRAQPRGREMALSECPFHRELQP
jgi:hypothetical protein